MKDQTVFNKVVRHLLLQRTISYSTEGGCLFYGPGKLKCAIGCLIPEKIYESKMEGRELISLFENYPKIRELFPENDLNLLDSLQMLHDNIFPENWESALINMAIEFNLKMPKI